MLSTTPPQHSSSEISSAIPAHLQQQSNAEPQSMLASWSIDRQLERFLRQEAAGAPRFATIARRSACCTGLCPTAWSCRHSVVWNCVCKHTKKPIILKGYVKVGAPCSWLPLRRRLSGFLTSGVWLTLREQQLHDPLQEGLWCAVLKGYVTC
jgi:hypothetical protein